MSSISSSSSSSSSWFSCYRGDSHGKELSETSKSHEVLSFALDFDGDLGYQKTVEQCDARIARAKEKGQDSLPILQQVLDESIKHKSGRFMHWLINHPDFSRLSLVAATRAAIETDFSQFILYLELVHGIQTKFTEEEKRELMALAMQCPISEDRWVIAELLREQLDFPCTKEHEVIFRARAPKKLAEKTRFYLMKALEKETGLGGLLKDISSLASLSESDKAQCIEHAFKVGFPEAVHMLVEAGFPITDDQQKRLHHLQARLKELASEREASARLGRGGPSRPFSVEHLCHYGSDEASREVSAVEADLIFQRRYGESLDFARYTIAHCIDFRDRTRGSEQLGELVDQLALRRQKGASLAGHKEWTLFGSKRYQKAYTNFNFENLYTRYLERWQAKGSAIPFQFFGLIEGERIPLTQIVIEQPNGPPVPRWVHTDPTYLHKIHTHINQLTWDLSTVREPKQKILQIGRIHWWRAHEMRFSRGSAAVAEVNTHALWEESSLPPFRRLKGMSLDCEALIEPDTEAYAMRYAAMRGVLIGQRLLLGFTEGAVSAPVELGGAERVSQRRYISRSGRSVSRESIS